MTFILPTQERFVAARVKSQRDMAERGVALIVGAFFGGRLVAELGIVPTVQAYRGPRPTASLASNP